jgi:hypothetical protein
MRGKKELLMLIVSPVLFIADVVLDINVAIDHWREGDVWLWFLTTTLIIVPFLITNIVAVIQNKGKRFYVRQNHRRLIYILSGWGIIVRFKTEFIHWKRMYHDNAPCQENYKECSCTDCEQYREITEKANKSAYKLALVRYAETATESAPQWCLQVYVMLSKWYIPWYIVLSAVISLLSLAWSVTGLEKARVVKKGHNFTWKAQALYFISQLFILASRLFAITIFMFVDRIYIIHFLVLDCVSITIFAMVSTLFKVFCCNNMACVTSASGRKMFRNIILSIPITIFVSDSVLESLSLGLCIQSCVFAIRSLENFLLIFITTSCRKVEFSIHDYDNKEILYGCTGPRLDILRQVAWSLIGTGFLLGVISLAVRHVFKRRRDAAAVPDTNNTDLQKNDGDILYYIPGTASATNRAFVIQ